MRQDYALSPSQRVDAREALALLGGTGISLAEAARRAIDGKSAAERVLVSDAISRFVRSRILDGKRERTVEWYNDKLRFLNDRFGDAWLGRVRRSEFVEWINAQKWSTGQRAAVVRACRALWRWGIAQEPQLATSDVSQGLATRGSGNHGEAEILTVAEVCAIMRNAGPYRSALALMLFAGIRPEEIHGRAKPPLLWSNVNIAEKIISVPPEISKTRKRRPVDNLPYTVWGWLEPRLAQEPVCQARTRQAIERAQAQLGRKWPHDATRHTFATYALALTNDPGKVAYWLGHEGNAAMLHRHYRGLATKSDAECFWKLLPV